MSIITKPFAWVLLKLYELTGNYGVAVILFALIVKLILLPFQMKSKKSMMRMARFTPLLKDLEKRYEGNRQKYQEEVTKLYKEEGVSPMGGCLWSLIPFPILIALYSVIRQPLTQMMGLAAEQVTQITDKLVSMGLYEIPKNATYAEITLSQLIHENLDAIREIVPNVVDINYNFLGLNLGDQPQWNFFAHVDWSTVSSWLPALGLFLIPFISAGLSALSMYVANRSSVQTQEQQSANKTMMLIMPLTSVWICFIMPAALGVYWIFNTLFAIIQDVILNRVYKKQLDKEDEERLTRIRAKEAELEAKRQETERLKAEGATTRNKNTSKKKIQANAKAQEEERIAALERAERAARRERMGLPAEEIPESQVGNRRYARGRAFVADRYTNPAEAAAKTAAAAAASADDAPIDPSVPEEELDKSQEVQVEAGASEATPVQEDIEQQEQETEEAAAENDDE
jgi:YidC/Oxa1 family membrane protein insertase